MRLLVHDYAGHPFQIELSRWLAAGGHQVLHLHASGAQTPKGPLARRAGDPASLEIDALSIGAELVKYDPFARWRQERAYGRLLAGRLQAFQPDAVLSANTPPLIQAGLQKAARAAGAAFISWVQDIFTLGADRALENWPAPFRRLGRRLIARTEFAAMRASDGLIVVSPDFLPLLAVEGVDHPFSRVIENWAPKDEIATRPKDNGWARRHGLDGRFVFLFSGTLGMKHDPSLLAELAFAFREDREVVVGVVSQGMGRQWLERERQARGLDNLFLFDYQPYADLPDVLGSADVLVAVLEDFAGPLSVPSKIYSYFCAARPILAAIPPANLARRLIEREAAGLCAGPRDLGGFLEAARRLRKDPALRDGLAANQRRYADAAFDIERIGPQFLSVLKEARSRLNGPIRPTL